MTICGLSLHLGTTESRKNKNSFSKSAPLILTVLTNAFHLTNVFLFFTSPYVTTGTNSVAPTLLQKLHITHNLSIRSDEGLTLETSAFRISVRWPIYIINSVDKTKFLYPATRSSDFVNHSYDYRPNWTPLSPITIINYASKFWITIG